MLNSDINLLTRRNQNSKNFRRNKDIQLTNLELSKMSSSQSHLRPQARFKKIILRSKKLKLRHQNLKMQLNL